MSLHANFLRFCPLLLLSGAFLVASPSIRAQDAGSSVVTAALGVPGDPGNGIPPAVYLTWWPADSARWSPNTYAVYSKDGLPGDPGIFTPAAFIRPQVDVLSVGLSINRSQRVGEDTDSLSRNIDGLYDKIVPVSGMGLAEKLAAIVEVSKFDAESAETLALLTRRHPAAALAAGVAFLESIPNGQIRTYEIRSCSPGAVNSADCNAVLGRVVVEGGTVRHLPAPGKPVHVPFVDENGNPDPRGNLNIPLRWATPDPLRERSFFQFGFDIYRVSLAFAEARNWDVEQPVREAFLGFLRDQPKSLQQVNDLPILTEELFSANDVADLGADPSTYFVIDDNERYDGGEPFNDGDTFYYFVAARDLLGRPGEISLGTRVTVCFQIPPQAPPGLKVSNHYTWDSVTDTQIQVFRIEWNHALPREDGPGVAGYWIYRWESIEQMHQMQGLPFSLLPGGKLTGGRIATVPANITEYIDNIGPHPFIAYSRGGDLDTPAVINDAEANKTYWYTVRAIDASKCAANVSGNSAPAYGVLRDRVGPDVPNGSISGECVEPTLTFEKTELVEGEYPPNPDLTYLRLALQRFSPEIAWVEYFIDPLKDERSFLGRFHYDEQGDDILVHSRQLRTAWLHENGVNQGRIFARTGTAYGQVSDLAEGYFAPGIPPDDKTENFVQQVNFTAMLNSDVDCDVHIPAPPTGISGTVSPIEITLNLTPGTEEWKLYRRVDDGALSMLRQGIASFEETPIFLEDSDLPLNGGRICYFLQVFDRHGNPSVLRRIGCIVSRPRTDLPAPMLSAIQPLGETPDTAGARINWFAPPGGVERFEVWIRSDYFAADDLSDDLRLRWPPLSLDFDESTGVLYRAYVTGRVGANFDSGPNFIVDWTKNFVSGLEYFIRVRSIGPGNATGAWSNEESFVWSPETDFSQPFDPSNCVVPWPVRGVPGVSEIFPVPDPEEFFEVGLKAVINPTSPDGSRAYNGGAVRVGVVRFGQLDVTLPKNWDRLPGNTEMGIFQMPADESGDLTNAFYRQRNGASLLNFMLFRYQVPSTLWPSVSGDVYQVSPLIEGIASSDIELQGKPAKAIYDPYFFLIEIPEAHETQAYHLYVKDTQPVIQGAHYRYLVVRFDALGEIAQVIPLGTVTAN